VLDVDEVDEAEDVFEAVPLLEPVELELEAFTLVDEAEDVFEAVPLLEATELELVDSALEVVVPEEVVELAEAVLRVLDETIEVEVADDSVLLIEEVAGTAVDVTFTVGMAGVTSFVLSYPFDPVMTT